MGTVRDAAVRDRTASASPTAEVGPREPSPVAPERGRDDDRRAGVPPSPPAIASGSEPGSDHGPSRPVSIAIENATASCG